LKQEWDLWIRRAESWIVFMVRVLLVHVRAYQAAIYLR
jgi:hypothetical protein